MKKLFFLIISILMLNVNAQENRIQLGIDEKLGATVPVDLKYKDEHGKEVILKDLLKTPVVFAFVYYECPGICTPLMNALAEVIDKSDMVPGQNYNIVTLSMDERETPELAMRKKTNYMKMIEREMPDDSWKFLTGDSASIKQLSDAAGFYFKREGKDFVHSGALIFISKEGKISRYLFPSYSERVGYAILPFDFKMAITETSEGKIIPTVAKMLQFCFSYDPEGKTYILSYTRIFGAIILVAAIIFAVVLVKKPKKKVIEKNEVENNG